MGEFFSLLFQQFIFVWSTYEIVRRWEVCWTILIFIVSIIIQIFVNLIVFQILDLDN